jgi:peptidase E
MNKQIIALGGGGFSMEPDNPLLDEYILKQSNKQKPKVCFIGTASGDAVRLHSEILYFLPQVKLHSNALVFIQSAD